MRILPASTYLTLVVLTLTASAYTFPSPGMLPPMLDECVPEYKVPGRRVQPDDIEYQAGVVTTYDIPGGVGIAFVASQGGAGKLYTSVLKSDLSIQDLLAEGSLSGGSWPRCPCPALVTSPQLGNAVGLYFAIASNSDEEGKGGVVILREQAVGTFTPTELPYADDAFSGVDPAPVMKVSELVLGRVSSQGSSLPQFIFVGRSDTSYGVYCGYAVSTVYEKSQLVVVSQEYSLEKPITHLTVQDVVGGDIYHDVFYLAEDGVVFLQNDGGTGFEQSILSLPGASFSEMTLANIDGEGNLDLVVLANDGLYWYAGSSNASAPFGTAAPEPLLAFVSDEDTVNGWGMGDVDGNGLDDLVYKSQAVVSVQRNGVDDLRTNGTFGQREIATQVLAEQTALTSVLVVPGVVGAFVSLQVESGEVYGVSLVQPSQPDFAAGTTSSLILGSGLSGSNSFVYGGAFDMDGDLQLDILFALRNIQPGVLIPGSKVYPIGIMSKRGGGDPAGSFSSTVYLKIPVAIVLDLKAADLDGDGDMDVVVTLSSGTSFPVSTVSIFLNPNTPYPWDALVTDWGECDLGTDLPEAAGEAIELIVQDLNNDQRPDVVLALKKDVVVFVQTPALFVGLDACDNLGWSDPYIRNLGGSSVYVDILMVDLTGDDNYELVVTIMTGVGAGSTWVELSYPGGGAPPTSPSSEALTAAPNNNAPVHAAYGDIDGDGRRDLVMTLESDYTLSYFSAGAKPTTPGGTPVFVVPNVVHSYESFFLADMNSDGLLDVVFRRGVAGSRQLGVVYAIDASPSFEDTTVIDLTDSTLGSGVGVGDWDGDGDTDLMTVSVSPTGPPSPSFKFETTQHFQRVRGATWTYPGATTIKLSDPSGQEDIPECAMLSGGTSAALCMAARLRRATPCARVAIDTSGLTAPITNCPPQAMAWTRPYVRMGDVEGLGGPRLSVDCDPSAISLTAGWVAAVALPGRASRIDVEDVVLRNLRSSGNDPLDHGLVAYSIATSTLSRAPKLAELKLVRVDVENSVVTGPIGGGAVYVGSKSREFGAVLTVDSSSFVDCRTEAATANGGAILVEIGGEAVVTNSTFTRNSAGGDGGAVATARNPRSTLTMVGSSVMSSTAIRGGALALGTESSVMMTLTEVGRAPITLDQMVFDNNTAVQAGGDLSVEGGGFVEHKSIFLTLSNVVSTNARAGGGGGFLFCGPTPAAISIESASKMLDINPTVYTETYHRVEFGPGVAIDNPSAGNVGGTVAEAKCELSLDPTMTVRGSRAGFGGGVGFSSTVSVDGVSDPFVLGSGELEVRGGEAMGYGVGWATPPVRAVWGGNGPPTASISSGTGLIGSAPLGSALRMGLEDGLGNAVEGSGLRSEVSLDPSSESVALIRGSGTLVRVTNSTVLEFELPEEGMSVILLRASSSVPFAAGSVTVLGRVVGASSGEAAWLTPVSADIEIDLCKAGLGSIDTNEPGLLICGPCEPGFESESVSDLPCVLGQTCAPNMVLAGSTNDSCVCKTGFWSPPGVDPGEGSGGFGCVSCPPGGVCLEGLSLPLPARGFYPDGPGRFLQCLRPAGCVGASLTSPCGRGYSGYMCNTCESGYFSAQRSGERTCEACPSKSAAQGAFSSAIVGVVVVAGVLAVLLGWLMSRSVGGDDGPKSRAEEIRAFRSQVMPASISFVVVACQVVGILGTSKFSWGESSEAVLSSFSVASIDMSLFAAECALGDFWASYVFGLLVPVVCLGLIVAGIGVIKVLGVFSGLSLLPLATVLDSSVFSFAPLFYIPVTQAAFVMFDCIPLPDGTYALDSNPGEACFKGVWWSYFPLGLLVVLVFVFGLPAYFAWSLGSHRHELFEPLTVTRYGSLYRLYRRKYYWGAVANLGKRLALVVAAVFTPPLLQIALTLATLLGWLSAVALWQPYYSPFHNVVDYRLNVLLVAVLAVGMASYSEGEDGPETFLFVLVLGIVLGLVVVAVHAIVTDSKRVWRMREDAFVAARERQDQLIRLVESELMDLEADAELLQSAGRFVALAQPQGER